MVVALSLPMHLKATAYLHCLAILLLGLSIGGVNEVWAGQRLNSHSSRVKASSKQANLQRSQLQKTRLKRTRQKQRQRSSRNATTKLKLRSLQKSKLVEHARSPDKPVVKMANLQLSLPLTFKIQSKKTTVQKKNATTQKKNATTQKNQHTRTGLKKKINRTSKTEAQTKKTLASISKGLASFRNSSFAKSLKKIRIGLASKLTVKLKHWETTAPLWLSKTIRTIRFYNPTSFAAFAGIRIKKDVKFLSAYMGANVLITNVGVPLWLAAGLDPTVASITYMISTPITALVLIVREQRALRQAGKDSRFLAATLNIVKEYHQYATRRFAVLDVRANRLQPVL